MSAPNLRSQSWFMPLWRTWLVARRRQAAAGIPHAEAGVTLLECLVAIAVIALTSALILPPLFIAAGSRSQNRRAEQALQIAQGEVNRIQAMVSAGQHFNSRLPATPAAIPGNSLYNVAAPSGPNTQFFKSIVSTCNTYNDRQVAWNSAIPIDIDGIDSNGDNNRCEPDFYMQVFRDVGVVTTREQSRPVAQQRPSSFRLGVRVWSNLAEGYWGQMTTPILPASIQLTSGQGNQRLRPLAALYPRVTWSDRSTTLCDLQRNISQERGGTPPNCS